MVNFSNILFGPWPLLYTREMSLRRSYDILNSIKPILSVFRDFTIYGCDLRHQMLNQIELILIYAFLFNSNRIEFFLENLLINILSKSLISVSPRRRSVHTQCFEF